MKNLTRMMPLMIMVALIAGVVGPVSMSQADQGAHAEEGTAQKAVLVTGASTGIGRKITETLAAKGIFVYAGARKEKDLKELDAIDNVQVDTAGRDRSGRNRRGC